MIYVATAGWSIPRATAASFPGDGTHLERYAGVLRGTEIDTSAYRDHASDTYARWAKQVPRAFRFAVKLPQRITHDGRLRGARKPLQEFFAGVSGLGGRLGPLVVQLPPSLAFETRVVRVFFTLLRELHDGPVACEPRHASWFDGRADELLVRHRIGRIAADSAVVPAAAQPGGWPGTVYYRLHGSPRKYWSVYDPARVAQWAQALQRLPRGAQAWCVFDNTAGGGAAPNALQLLALLDKKRHDITARLDMASLDLLVTTSALVATRASRLAKIRALADYLASIPPAEIDLAVHYLSGSLPQGRIGIGYRALQAVAENKAADTATLQVGEVDAAIKAVSASVGPGSTARRNELLAGLFGSATAAEQDFLLRLLAGELRQGALDGVMIDAIAAAAKLPAGVIRRAAMYAPELGRIAAVALTAGAAGLEEFQLRLFHPVAPMLAQTAQDTGEALRELAAPVQFDWKMDGGRIQVHKQGAEVRIYTRALNEIGAAIPEVVAAVQALPATALILDGETLAFTAAGRPHPFQVTMRRFGRSLNVQSMMQTLPIRAFFFDCLLLDGAVLTERPLSERMAALDRAVPEEQRMPRLVTADAAQATAFHDAALHAGHEGVMAKSLTSTYEAGSRGASWFKIKRAHTLDLVILAAEWGNGRRVGLLSNLHLGALDPDSGQYVMLGKTFKGLTDAMLAWQTRELLAREISRDRMTVYVRPELVVEIAFSDLQASTRYPGGLALRLARVKRFRDDKRAEEADTMEAVRRIQAGQG